MSAMMIDVAEARQDKCDDSPLDSKIGKPPAHAGIPGSVLDDPVFRVILVDGQAERLTLPGLLAALAGDRVASLPGVRVHQAHTVHMFLAHLVSIAGPDNGTEEGAWRAALLSVCDDPKAWQIIPADGEYGFMQPARPADKVSKKIEFSVSGIDLLADLAKAHSFKPESSAPQEDDVWIWQLVTVQTGAGFPGVSNFGCFRMNGGYGSRSLWAVYDQSWGPGRRVFEDARLMLEMMPAVIEEIGFSADGLKLMWLAPWPEGEALSAGDLDYRVIEICRRINFARNSEGAIHAKVGNSNRPRTTLAETEKKNENPMKGYCGDIWAPVAIKERKAITMTGSGLSYDIVTRYACPPGDGNIRPSAASRRRVHDPVLVIAGVANGQGKTEGLHLREIPLPQEKEGQCFDLTDDNSIKAANKMVEEAGKVVTLIRQAVREYSGKNVNGGFVDRIAARLSERIDDVFFEHFAEQASGKEDSHRNWVRFLFWSAEAILEDIFATAPVKEVKRLQRINSTLRFFRGSFWSEKDNKVKFSIHKEAILMGRKNDDGQ